MSDDRRLIDLERRLALVESFLDGEMRERQHQATRADPFSHGPLNPFYGARERLIGFSASPQAIPDRPEQARDEHGFEKYVEGPLTARVPTAGTP